MHSLIYMAELAECMMDVNNGEMMIDGEPPVHSRRAVSFVRVVVLLPSFRTFRTTLRTLLLCRRAKRRHYSRILFFCVFVDTYTLYRYIMYIYCLFLYFYCLLSAVVVPVLWIRLHFPSVF